MTRRIKQVNELLRGELARLISQEVQLSGGLITISYVDCSSDLKRAKVGISVLPDNLSRAALLKLGKRSGYFCQILKKKLNLKYIPKFTWLIDETEKNATKIEKILEQIKQGKQ